MSAVPIPFLTPEEYLKRERRAPYKSEYYFGEVFSMAGAKRAHNRISVNTLVALSRQLKGKPCEAYGSDMRVQTTSQGLYAYPDVSVVCGEQLFRDDHQDTLLNPAVIIEVLSPATETYDRGKKFEQYRRVTSLRSYILIAQDRPRVEQFSRREDGQWLYQDASGLDGAMRVEAIGCTLSLAEVYDKVRLEPGPEDADALGE
jgi:Uma2 family endonuclease